MSDLRSSTDEQLQFIITMWICSSIAGVARPTLETLANGLGLLSFFGIIIAWTFVPTRPDREPLPARHASRHAWF